MENLFKKHETLFTIGLIIIYVVVNIVINTIIGVVINIIVLIVYVVLQASGAMSSSSSS